MKSISIEAIRRVISKAKNPMTARDVAKQLGYNTKRTYDRLWVLVQKGELEMWKLEYTDGTTGTAFLPVRKQTGHRAA